MCPALDTKLGGWCGARSKFFRAGVQGTAGCKVRGERSDLRAGQERSVVDGVNVFGERGSVEDPRAMASQ